LAENRVQQPYLNILWCKTGAFPSAAVNKGNGPTLKKWQPPHNKTFFNPLLCSI
jgi:hypothetical protein